MYCDLLLFILHAVCCQKQEQPELDTVYGTMQCAVKSKNNLSLTLCMGLMSIHGTRSI